MPLLLVQTYSRPCLVLSPPSLPLPCRLYTGQRAYAGEPRALLGHQIAREGMRPKFPPGTPPGYVNLATKCWHPDPAARCDQLSVLGGVSMLCCAVQFVFLPPWCFFQAPFLTIGAQGTHDSTR